MKRFLCISYFCLVSLFASESEYQLGHGLKLGEFPLYMGGYFSLDYEHGYGKERVLELDELAIMFYGEYEHLSYMLELEGEEIYRESFGDNANASHQDRVHLERLYVNYNFNDNYDLKTGKFNSIIGLWNQNPINVLRDTSSNPRITEQIFPKFTTGAEFKYQQFGEDRFTLHLMVQESEDMDELFNRDEVYNNFDTNRHYGMGTSFLYKQTLFQFNAGYFEVKPDQEYTYLLGAFQYELDTLRLQGEFGSQFDDDETVATSGYLQGVYRIVQDHEGILRVESCDDEKTGIKDSFGVFGYTYRPYYSIAIKSEYQWHSYKKENKFLLSFSALF